jgi:predicted naringenin-chalcone synthase
MPAVAITRVVTAQPPYSVSRDESVARIAAATHELRRVEAIAKGSRIDRRATAVPPSEVGALGTIAERNAVYKQVAPPLAIEVARAALADAVEPLGLLLTSSCTGYMVPGWDVQIVEELSLPTDVVRLPLTQAGCSGGVLALSRGAEYLRAHPDRSALAAAVELCSLAFHPSAEPGNLVSALLFGDGAGAALLESGSEDGLRIVDSLSALVPCSQDALGFDLTDRGFYPLLALDLSSMLPAPTLAAAARLLDRNGLQPRDLSFALLHPGGPRILDDLLQAFALPERAAGWSYDSLRELGNTSSAAIFDVIRRYLADEDAPRGWGLVAAFGPGVSIELLLVQRC